jgi:hypothetical protein
LARPLLGPGVVIGFACIVAVPLVLILGEGETATPGRTAELEPGAAELQVAQPSGQVPVEVEDTTGTEEDASQYEDQAAAEPAPKCEGYILLRLQSRWAEERDVDDHDLYGVIGIDYAGAEDKGWGLHLLLRGSWGLDSQSPNSPFYGVQDTYAHQLEGRVYRAYVDVPRGDRLRYARLGRMVIYETPETAYFDGAHVETEPVGPTRFVVGAYGGLSAHLFEEWPSEEGMGGVYTSFRPWEDGQLRLDWMRLGDDERFGKGENDLVSAALTHDLGDHLRLEGSFSWLDGDDNDARLKGFWVWPEEELTVRFAYYRLLEAQNNLAYELNPFFNSLNTYFPYDESQLVVSKTFGETFELFGGLDVRRVEDENDIGRYNRDFDRYYLTAAFPELLPLNTTASVTGEVWDSPGNDAQTWGLDLTSRATEETRISVGSYYSLYKYYLDIDTEREDVRTFYAELRNSVSESMDVMARYEFEHEETDSYHYLRLGVTWRF